MSVTHWLSIIEGHKIGQRYLLTKKQGTLGRGPSNAVQVFDSEVSRVHCRYNLNGHRLEIADLDSSNGTFVNGDLVERHELSHGDILKVGLTVFELEVNEAQPDDAVATPLASSNAVAANDSEEDPQGSLSYLPINGDLSVETPDSDSSSDGTGTPAQMVQIVSDMNFIYHASLLISGEGDSSKMLERLIELIFAWIAADRCCVLLCDQSTVKLSVRAFQSRVQQPEEKKRLISQSIVNYVRENRVGILTCNAMEDQRLNGKDSIVDLGIQEAICVPIRGRDEFLGLIYIDTLAPAGKLEIERFNRDHLELLIAIGLQVGITIENERNRWNQLQRHSVTIGQTATTLSHHLKNLQQGINGGSHVVEIGLERNDIDLMKKGWRIVGHNQQEISRLVKDMLIIGQPYDPHFVKADLNEVVTQVFEEIEPLLNHRNIQFEWRPAQNPTMLLCDPRGVQRVVYNLINVCAATCGGVTNAKISVLISSSENGTKQISITDNGLPIQLENPQLPFSSAEAELNHKPNPIELAACRKLVHGHNGVLNISHPKVGGNVFTVRLPLESLDSAEA